MAYTTIKKPSDYFNTKLYTGNGSTQNITGVGFQPDWVWTKCRSTINSSRLIDAVRGVTKAIVSNSNGAEFTETNGLSAFGADGYTLNGNLASMNTNGDTYASWNWKANGAGVANTDGDITSSVSVNTTAGFSIVSYTGSGTIGNTVGHGLGQKPAMVITKNRDAASTCVVWHQGGTSTKNTALNSSEIEYDSSGSGWAQGINGVPTNSVLSFTAGASGNNNVMDSAQKYISYCFAEKQGFSKFGSYTGNASADGAFIYTGFSPAFVIIKNINAAESWSMFDGKRPDSNQTNGRYSLSPNSNGVEYQAAPLIDLVSNGFKLRTSTNSLNVAQNYIYMAFASEPLVGDNPATAR